MKKIIFLDFDGVLNTEHYQNYLMYERKPRQDKHGVLFDPEAVRQLKRIVDVTKADIVIESSWKYLGLAAMQEMWKERDLPGKVTGITDSSVSDNWLLTANLDDIDPTMGHCNGVEIASWLADYTKNDVRGMSSSMVSMYALNLRCPTSSLPILTTALQKTLLTG